MQFYHQLFEFPQKFHTIKQIMNRLIFLILLFHYVHLTTLNGARICYQNHNPNALRKSCSICKQLDNSHTFYQLRIHIACANLARHGCCSTNYQSERRISEKAKVNEAFSQLIMSLQLIQKKTILFIPHKNVQFERVSYSVNQTLDE